MSRIENKNTAKQALCWVYKSLRIITIVVAALIAISACYIKFNSRIVQNTAALENVQKLEDDGCKPARQASTDIAVIKVTLANIEEDIDAIQDEQKAQRKENRESFAEILREVRRDE